MMMDQINVATAAVLDESEVHERFGMRHESRTFQLPGSIWAMMFACYGVFFGGMVLATVRGVETAMMLVISAGFAIVYFGTATVINNVAKAHTFGVEEKQAPGPWGIDTVTGRLDYGAASAQILTVPAVLAIFAVAIVIIRAIVIPG